MFSMKLGDLLQGYQEMVDSFDSRTLADRHACLFFSFQLMGMLSRFMFQYPRSDVMSRAVMNKDWLTFKNERYDEGHTLVSGQLCHVRHNGCCDPLYDFKIKSDGSIKRFNWRDRNCFFAWCRFNRETLGHLVPDRMSYEDFVSALYDVRNNIVHECFVGHRPRGEFRIEFVYCDQVPLVLNSRCYVSIVRFCKDVFELASNFVRMHGDIECSNYSLLGLSAVQYDVLLSTVDVCYRVFWQMHDLELHRIYLALCDAGKWDEIVKHFVDSNDVFVVDYFNSHYHCEVDGKRFFVGEHKYGCWQNVQLRLGKSDFNEIKNLLEQVQNYENKVIRDVLRQKDIWYF